LIRKGAKLGVITDVFGNLLQEIVSPVDGFIIYLSVTPPINKGETLLVWQLTKLGEPRPIRTKMPRLKLMDTRLPREIAAYLQYCFDQFTNLQFGLQGRQCLAVCGLAFLTVRLPTIWFAQTSRSAQ
jgi:hypothetical protein